MLLAKPLGKLGDLRGTIFDFEKSGDILLKHVHTEQDVHISIVARGKIKAYSHDWEKEVEAGGVIDFRVGEPHEIMALEDNSRIINIIKKAGGDEPDITQYTDNKQIKNAKELKWQYHHQEQILRSTA